MLNKFVHIGFFLKKQHNLRKQFPSNIKKLVWCMQYGSNHHAFNYHFNNVGYVIIGDSF